ncbi:hypothetical protein AB0M23_21465 [Streptomyces sp. NPDC052077]|uniref:hypothetical protein n=1 Tax=Streptomyces sp. NPDC052077 TaxID=3154757 RepID=UPI0034198E1A
MGVRGHWFSVFVAVKVEDPVAPVPGGCRGGAGGGQEQAGQGMPGTEAGGGAGRAVLRGPRCLYEVRHARR